MSATIHPIDHLVLAVERLELARARYEALGFTVQADRMHPFGTENCCIFFANRTYLEPLAVGDREKVDAAIVGQNLFVRRHNAFAFRQGEGFAMLAFRTEDAQADLDRFKAAGLATGSVHGFERKATAPDGSETVIGVRIASAVDHRAPDALFFVCQHLSADVIWQPDATRHANGAIGVTGVYASEPNPADFQYYLENASGIRAIHADSFGITAQTPTGPVAILTPAGLKARYGIDCDHAGRGPRLRLFRLAVADLAAMRDRLADGGVEHFAHRGRLIVPAPAGQGADIAFEQAETAAA